VLKSGDSNQTVGGRAYILHVPSAYKGTTAVPLIVDFHPIGGTDSGEESSSPWKAVTDPEGVITAYPQGKDSPNFGAAWNVGPCCVDSSIDDVAFAKALVAQVETTACIDTKRIYAVGFSMGGGMSHYIACHAADVFAAVAPTAFDLLGTSTAITKGNVADCKPTRPIPVLSFRGTADSTAIYAGGDSSVVTGMPIHFLGAEACWKQWGQINGCTDTPTYPATPSSATYNCAYYKQCQGSVQVGVCINNSGHSYATSAGAQSGWTFLKQFTLP
jgi:polyhydroxybutyrate depolymerase